ncbi:DJ-1/PfpI family protein, partial [Kitasatospora sp. NPDC007106]
EGRRATTHHLGLDLLDATGVHAVRARVVDDGDLVSGAGVTSGLDLALYLLEREVGPQIAHAVEELFAHERRGTVWRSDGPAPAAF